MGTSTRTNSRQVPDRYGRPLQKIIILAIILMAPQEALSLRPTATDIAGILKNKKGPAADTEKNQAPKFSKSSSAGSSFYYRIYPPLERRGLCLWDFIDEDAPWAEKRSSSFLNNAEKYLYYLLYPAEPGGARCAAKWFARQLDDGLGVLKKTLFGSTPVGDTSEISKFGAVYGLRKMLGRMRARALAVFTEGLYHSNPSTVKASCHGLFLLEEEKTTEILIEFLNSLSRVSDKGFVFEQIARDYHDQLGPKRKQSENRLDRILAGLNKKQVWLKIYTACKLSQKAATYRVKDDKVKERDKLVLLLLDHPRIERKHINIFRMAAIRGVPIVRVGSMYQTDADEVRQIIAKVWKIIAQTPKLKQAFEAVDFDTDARTNIKTGPSLSFNDIKILAFLDSAA